MNASKARRVRSYSLAFLLGLASFYAGTHLVPTRPAPPDHPLTGRQVAGLATSASWLDRAARDKEEAAEQALQLVGIRPGMIVADVGAGTGYMTIRLARLVGPHGKVFANDIQPAVLRIVRDKIRTEHATNVELVEGSETDARLPDNALDLVLLVDVYHEFLRPQDMLQSLRKSLKPEGELVLVEYRKEDPTVPIASTHRMSVSDIRTESRPKDSASIVWSPNCLDSISSSFAGSGSHNRATATRCRA